MKTKIAGLIIMFLFGTLTLFAQSQKDEIKIYGNCGLCKKRIENAAKSVKGVSAADWKKDTQMLSVTYDESKTNLDIIQLAIAKVGHDTQDYRATDKAYQALPGCCHYDRAEVNNNKPKN